MFLFLMMTDSTEAHTGSFKTHEVTFTALYRAVLDSPFMIYSDIILPALECLLKFIHKSHADFKLFGQL